MSDPDLVAQPVGRLERHNVRRLEQLGYMVTLPPRVA